MRTIAVSLACRYLHSAVGQIAQEDFHSAETLIMKLAENCRQRTSMIVMANEQDFTHMDSCLKTDPLYAELYVLQICIKVTHLPIAGCKSRRNRADYGIFIKMDGVITLFAHENADFDELYMFVKMIGASCVMCHASCAEQLHITPARTGNIMKWDAQLSEYINRTVCPDLHQVYSVLQACHSKAFQVPEFEPFYLDMSHRIRHKGATAVGYKTEDNLLLAQ